jgi:hypothetical protein
MWVQTLPGDASKRDELLGAYFSSLVVADSEPARPTGWQVTVTRPDSLGVFVDPGLKLGLDALGGIPPTEIGLRVWRNPVFQLSLEDSWTAYSWSCWLGGRARQPRQVVILHADDHLDFDSPHLALEPGQLRDLITGDAVDLSAPPTVKSAVVSSGIGVAGFFAPMIRSFDEMEIRHLRHAVPLGGAGWHALRVTDIVDSILRPGARRPAIEIGQPDVGKTHPLRYLSTSEPAAWLSNLPDWPILLHVDLDYLSNRFNGDSDWESAPKRHDPSAVEVAQALGAMLDALDACPGKGQIEDIAIALSPGFFPAEFWTATVETLGSRLSRVRGSH